LPTFWNHLRLHRRRSLQLSRMSSSRYHLRLHRRRSLQLPRKSSSRYATISKTSLSLAPDLEAPITSRRHVSRVWSLIAHTCYTDSNSSVKCCNSVVSLQDLCRARMATKTHPDKPEPIHVGQRIAGLSRESEASNNSPSSRSSTSSW
jgi:hypothetical protein